MAYDNKIIIVGNGYDLAHGYKTAFCDFADYLIEKKIAPTIIDFVKYKEKRTFLSDSFCEIVVSRLNTNRYNDNYDKLIQMSYVESGDIKAAKLLQNNTSFLKEVLNNKLLGELYQSTSGNWFDIENSYFSKLKRIKSIKPFSSDRLLELNSEFNEIKNLFIEYLKTVDTKMDESINEFLLRSTSSYNNVYFINFNYTNSIQKYIAESERIKINHIHGSLEKGEIIFGYGNDQDDDYKEIKDTGIDEFLRFFKTFEYMDGNNYSRIYSEAIERFVSYDVDILGHSLGQTDKTLLSEILNNKKCTSINFFKRNDLKEKPIELKESFKKLQYAASRIITDEVTLRKKIVNFTNAQFFP